MWLLSTYNTLTFTTDDDQPPSQDDLFTDEYILGPLACALIKADVDPSDLASCLEVRLDEGTESGSKKDKIVNLILLWVSEHCVERSKKKLLTCLNTLKNAVTFKKALTEYGRYKHSINFLEGALLYWRNL